MVENSNQVKHDKHEVALTSSQLKFIGIISLVLLSIGLIFQNTKWSEGLATENELIYQIFNGISQLGNEYFLIGLFVVIYIGIDKIFAQRLILSYSITSTFMNFFKNLFQDPRPSGEMVDGEIFGFPSGHTTNSVSIWGYTLLTIQTKEKKRRLTLIQLWCWSLLLFIPLSRLIIGVHDIEDIVGGYLLSILILLLFIKIYPKLSQANKNLSQGKKSFIYSIIALFFWIIPVVILGLIYPDLWEEQAEKLAQNGGILLGMAISIPMEMEHIKYNPAHYSIKQRIISSLLALAITFGFYLGLSFLLKPLPYQFILRGIRYMLLIGVLIIGLPFLIQKIFPKSEKKEEMLEEELTN